MAVIVFPGQGSQKKGMGNALFDRFEDIVKNADEVLGYSIKELCLRDPQCRLNQTQFTQPALYVVNALSYLAYIADTGEIPTYVAGHSLGEYNALLAAGAFDFKTGLKLVKRRGEAMARASEGGMAAVLGATPAMIEGAINEGGLSGIDIAGLNTPSQMVISGPKKELDAFARQFRSSDTIRCIPLNVSAAFHSRYMKSASEEFGNFLKSFRFSELSIPVISNVTAALYQADQVVDLLATQITHAVRWAETIEYLLDQGERHFKEIGPGNVLTGMIREIQHDHRSARLQRSDTQQSVVVETRLDIKPPTRTLMDLDKVSDRRSASDAAFLKNSKRRNNQHSMSRWQEKGNGADIAIVGMACRFPGAADYNQFWENLVAGVNSIREITPDRWDINKYYSPDINAPNKSISKWCGMVDGIDNFDNGFFNISPREAKNMDPQQRLLLEETWHCIEDSGVSIDFLRQKRTAVYIGVMTSDYRQEATSPDVVTDSYAASGNYDAMLANRISYAFGFSGASESVDTACASALVAINGAKRSLVLGESDYAIAGGVNLNLHPWKYISFSKARMLSPDGQCKAFDAQANGYVPGEGVGVLLMQRLEDALKTNNHIYGVIKGCATNHGGRTQSLTAPRVEAQRDVILLAYQEAKIVPDTVSYVEAHGTGTSLGDPIEIEALTRAFRRFTDEKNFCKVGSVKSNIGHLEAAAGVAGVIKVLLMMKHRKIPKSLNINKINPIIRFDNSPFQIATKLSGWKPKNPSAPLRAGVSSFGMGGVNAHLLLEAYTQKESLPDTKSGQLFVLSAKSRSSLKQMLAEWKSFSKTEAFSQSRFKDLCWTMLTGREAFPYRYGVYASDKHAIKQALLNSSVENAAFQNIEKFYCLRIGTLNLSGFSQIEPLLKIETAFFYSMQAIQSDLVQLTTFCRTCEDLRRIEKLSTGFYNSEWDEDSKIIYAFMVSYASASALIKIGAAPGLISGEGYGALASLAAVGILRPIDALAMMTGLKSSDQIYLCRPTVPFFDPVDSRVIAPFRFSENYVQFIRNELQIDDDLLSYYIEKGQLLFQSQYTFQRYVKEWGPFLEVKGKTLEQLLFVGDDEALQCVAKKEKMLMLVIIISSLRKVRMKWDLTQQKPIVDALFSELVDLIVDGVMSKASLVDLLLGNSPDIKAIAESLCKRHHRVDLSKPYQYIHTQNRTLVEIEDAGRWLKQITSAKTQLPQIEKMVCVDFGEISEKAPIVDTVAFQIAPDLDKSFKEFLLHLWLNGVQIEWRKIFSEKQFNKIRLPGYPFERKAFWLVRDSLDAKKLKKKLGITSKINQQQPAGKAKCEIIENHTGLLVECQRKAYMDKSVRNDTTFLSKIWKQASIEESGLKISGDILLFDYNEKVRDALQSCLRNMNCHAHVVLVAPGDRFQRLNQRSYLIRPENETNYQSLFESLKADNIDPAAVVHLWSSNAKTLIENQSGCLLNIGIYTLTRLYKELVVRHIPGPIYLIHVHLNYNDSIQLDQAAMGGFLKTLQLENPNFKCKTIDIRLPVGMETDLNILAGSIRKELSDKLCADTNIRYYGTKRWSEQFDARRLDGTTNGRKVMRVGGVYLITGGTGGLGRIFSKYLVDNYEAKIILIGRSGLSKNKKLWINSLRKNGAECVYYEVDITDREAVKRTIQNVKKQFQHINGVFHAAGEIKDAFLIEKKMADIQAVIRPKILGAINLDEILKSEPLDFFAFFSSIVAIDGNAGQSDYAYANAYMDAYAEYREGLCKKNMRFGHTISINWPYWADGGMHLTDSELDRQRKERGWEPMPTAVGLRDWELAIHSELNQVVVRYGRRIKMNANGGVALSDRNCLSLNKQKNEIDISRYNKAEEYLKQVMAQLLDMAAEDIDSSMSFKELGVDSIMIHHFNETVEHSFSCLSKTLLFEYQTVGELVEYFIRNHEFELNRAIGISDASLGNPSDDNLSSQTIGASGNSMEIKKQFDSEPSLSESCNCHCDDDIAIVGLAGRYPKADTLEQFWDNLKNERDCITEVPAERWSLDEFYDPNPENATNGKMYCKWGGFLENMDQFDPLFFQISPQEAELMDPQERLFLETAWCVLEDGGYTPKSLRAAESTLENGDVGVFVGVTNNSYHLHGPATLKSGATAIPQSMPWSVANRVSYIFNLNGPSLSIDTACASSLTAIHMACESIRSKECSAAIAGGVNLYLHPSKYVWLCQMRMLSAKGRCSSFGDGADGFVPGEGVGAVLLKPLSAAVKNRDNIYAVIKGSAMNHGGMIHGYTVPNPNAQAALIKNALKKSKVDPRTISYIETHGTGTRLGDPIEVTGLVKGYIGSATGSATLSIGSVKSNIGHLEAAAGIAGLTKVLLQMNRHLCVPSLHSKTLNADIDFNGSSLKVQQQAKSWPRETNSIENTKCMEPVRCGVSSFGAGGVNVHMIIEEYMPTRAESAPKRNAMSEHLIVLSAKSLNSLEHAANNLCAYLKKYANDVSRNLSIENIAYTLQVGREPMDARMAVIAENVEELCKKLERYLDDPKNITGRKNYFLSSSGNQESEMFEALTKGKFGADFIDLVLRHKDMEKLAGIWTSGIDVQWEKLYVQQSVRKVSLPTYSFERQRFWVGCESKPVKVETKPHNRRMEQPECSRKSVRAGRSKSTDLSEITDTLIDWVSEILKVSTSTIQFDKNLREYGFNSLSGIRIANRVEEKYGLRISPGEIFDCQSISGLTQFLIRQIKAENRNRKRSPNMYDDQNQHDVEDETKLSIDYVSVEDLSDTDVDYLLKRVQQSLRSKNNTADSDSAYAGDAIDARLTA